MQPMNVNPVINNGHSRKKSLKRLSRKMVKEAFNKSSDEIAQCVSDEEQKEIECYDEKFRNLELVVKYHKEAKKFLKKA